MKNIIKTLVLILGILFISNCKKCDYQQSECDNCPDGFTKNQISKYCEKISHTEAEFNGTKFTIGKGDSITSYGWGGANLYVIDSNTNYPINSTTSSLIDNSGSPLSIDTNLSGFWNERLNFVGVWGSSVPINQWIGFSVCVEVQEKKKICIAMAADNRCRFNINGHSPILVEFTNSNTYNFTRWHVFEYELLQGNNIIEMEGLNTGSYAAFGAEIYDASFADLKTWTTQAELESSLIFSTKDKIGLSYQIGESNGYSCTEGFAVDFCSDSIPICTSIERIMIPCKEIELN